LIDQASLTVMHSHAILTLPSISRPAHESHATAIIKKLLKYLEKYLEKQPEYGSLLRRLHFAAKKRLAGDALASAECICVSSFSHSFSVPSWYPS